MEGLKSLQLRSMSVLTMSHFNNFKGEKSKAIRNNDG